MKIKQLFSLSDLIRRFLNSDMIGVISAYSSETGLYKIKDEQYPDIETDWCRVSVSLKLDGENALGSTVLVLHPRGADTGGIITDVLVETGKSTTELRIIALEKIAHPP